MLSLGLGEHQRIGKSVKNVWRGRAAAALFEPGIPGRADVRPLGDFLASEPRGAPSARKSESRGIEPPSTIFQKSAEGVLLVHRPSILIDFMPARSPISSTIRLWVKLPPPSPAQSAFRPAIMEDLRRIWVQCGRFLCLLYCAASAALFAIDEDPARRWIDSCENDGVALSDGPS